MSTHLKKNFALLRALESVNARQRKAIISTSPNHLIRSICEIADNLLKGNVELNPQERKRLKKYKSLLRRIVDKKVPLNDKKKALIQQGGALPAILIPALTAVASLIGEVFRR